MNKGRSSGHAKRPTYNAVTINLMAKFVQISRKSEGVELHLQDRNILHKISVVAQQTSNRQLKLLHQRLVEELGELDIRQPFAHKPDTSSEADKPHR